MEPIGQKVLTPTSEEIFVASDMDDNSLENLETRIFDETLDGVLSELNVGEELIDDLVDNVEGSDSVKSETLTKNKIDSKITASKMTSSEIVDSNIALEVMEEILLSDEVSIEKDYTFQKTENSIPEISEAKEIRIKNNEKILDFSDENVEAFNKKNDLDAEKYDVSENQLQTFFHFTNIQGDNSEFSGDFKEDIVKKYNNDGIDSLKSNSELLEAESFQSESSDLESFLSVKNQVEPDEKVVNPDFFKTNQVILQPISSSKSEEQLNESEIVINLKEPEPELNISKKAYINEKNRIVGELESDIEEKELNIPERLKTVSTNKLEENKSDSNKVAFGELGEDNFTNVNKEELTQNSIKGIPISDFGIDENLNKKGTTHVTNNKIVENQNSLVKGIVSGVSVDETEVFEVSEDQNLSSKVLGTEVFQGKDNKKMLDDGNSMFNERVNSSFQNSDTFKVSEEQKVVLKEKLNDVVLPLTEKVKVSEEQKVVLKEKLNDVVLPLTEKVKVSEEQKVVLKEKLNEDFQGVDNKKVSKEQQDLAKGKGINGIQGMEKSLLDDLSIIEETKSVSDIKISDKDFSKEFYEKTSTETLNNPRNFTSQESELPINTKSFTENYNPIVTNSNTDASSISGVKVGEATNSMSDPLRNADLPFNVEQIVNRVRILRGNGVEEMTLRLNPEELGQITLKIRQSGADLSIDMRVENPQAKLLVESGFDSLRNRFLDNDFSYQDLALNVDINERDSQFGRDRRNSEFEENISSADRKETEDIKQAEEKENLGILTDSGLNLYV